MLLYELGNLPMFLCIGLSVTGLFAPGFDRALGYAAVLQPCIIAVAAATGIWNHFMRKKRGTLPENRESWRDGFRYWAQALFKEELEPYKKANGGNLAKTILFSVGEAGDSDWDHGRFLFADCAPLRNKRADAFASALLYVYCCVNSSAAP